MRDNTIWWIIGAAIFVIALVWAIIAAEEQYDQCIAEGYGPFMCRQMVYND